MIFIYQNWTIHLLVLRKITSEILSWQLARRLFTLFSICIMVSFIHKELSVLSPIWHISVFPFPNTSIKICSSWCIVLSRGDMFDPVMVKYLSKLRTCFSISDNFVFAELQRLKNSITSSNILWRLSRAHWYSFNWSNMHFSFVDASFSFEPLSLVS